MTRDLTSQDRDAMTRAELLSQPAVIDITTAARALVGSSRKRTSGRR